MATLTTITDDPRVKTRPLYRTAERKSILELDYKYPPPPQESSSESSSSILDFSNITLGDVKEEEEGGVKIPTEFRFSTPEPLSDAEKADLLLSMGIPPATAVSTNPAITIDPVKMETPTSIDPLASLRADTRWMDRKPNKKKKKPSGDGGDGGDDNGDDSDDDEDGDSKTKTTKSSDGTSSTRSHAYFKRAEHKLGAWCRSVFGSSGVGGSGVRLDDPNISITDLDDDGNPTKKLKLTKDGKIPAVPSVRNELHWHPKQVKSADKLRDNATAEEFERVLPEYISGGLLSAIYTVYSVFQLNLKLSHFTLKDLILGDNLESMTPKTKQSHYFRLIVIQAFREERFNNSQRMRSVQGAKIQHIITSRLYQNLLHSCGAHYQSS